jgi:hypothetical protein
VLQGGRDDAKAIARRLEMRMVVDNLDAWWARIGALDIRERYGASVIRVDRLARLGLGPIQLWDPAGVRWSLYAPHCAPGCAPHCGPLGDPQNA